MNEGLFSFIYKLIDGPEAQMADSEGPALYPLVVFRPFAHLKVVVPAENSAQLSLKTPPMVDARSATVFFFVGRCFSAKQRPLALTVKVKRNDSLS